VRACWTGVSGLSGLVRCAVAHLDGRYLNRELLAHREQNA
jgi:hypothetical protein